MSRYAATPATINSAVELGGRGTTTVGQILQVVIENTEIEFGKIDTTIAVRSTLEEQLLFRQRRVFRTMRAFDDIEHLFARLPGRKSLIWLSAGFPMVVNGHIGKGVQVPELTFVQDVEAALKKLNKADITLHVVDAVGLPVTTRSYSDVMFELALRSGGTVFMGRNDLDEGMREALKEMYSGYTVGFNVADDAVTGVHEITVRVNRKGLRLRYRESYEWATAAPIIKSK